VGAMETVSSFKHSEVFKKMNSIFAAVGSGGCGGGFGGGGIEEEVKLLAPIHVSLAYIQGSSHIWKFSLFLSTEICSHLLLVRPV